jgi:hypothetical protein
VLVYAAGRAVGVCRDVPSRGRAPRILRDAHPARPLRERHLRQPQPSRGLSRDDARDRHRAPHREPFGTFRRFSGSNSRG